MALYLGRGVHLLDDGDKDILIDLARTIRIQRIEEALCMLEELLVEEAGVDAGNKHGEADGLVFLLVQHLMAIIHHSEDAQTLHPSQSASTPKERDERGVGWGCCVAARAPG